MSRTTVMAVPVHRPISIISSSRGIVYLVEATTVMKKLSHPIARRILGIVSSKKSPNHPSRTQLMRRNGRQRSVTLCRPTVKSVSSNAAATIVDHPSAVTMFLHLPFDSACSLKPQAGVFLTISPNCLFGVLTNSLHWIIFRKSDWRFKKPKGAHGRNAYMRKRGASWRISELGN